MEYNNYKDEKNYWGGREVPNTNDQDEGQEIRALLKAHIKPGYKSLEFGAGTGRTFGAYSSSNEVTTWDIVKTYKDRLKEKADKIGLKLNQYFQEKDFDVLPFKDDQFDVSIAVQSLLHVRPENISKVVKELIRVSKRLVVANYYDETGNVELANHNFSHNLMELLRDEPVEYVAELSGNLLLVYGVTKKEESKEVEAENIAIEQDEVKPKTKKKRRRKKSNDDSSLGGY